MKTVNNTKVSIVRSLNTKTLVSGLKKDYPTWFVSSKRSIDAASYAAVNRRFSDKKFGSSEQAKQAAYEFGSYLQSCNLYQYINATRPRGRPFKTELYATKVLA
jgi:hypothetical protein